MKQKLYFFTIVFILLLCPNCLKKDTTLTWQQKTLFNKYTVTIPSILKEQEVVNKFKENDALEYNLSNNNFNGYLIYGVEAKSLLKSFKTEANEQALIDGKQVFISLFEFDNFEYYSNQFAYFIRYFKTKSDYYHYKIIAIFPNVKNEKGMIIVIKCNKKEDLEIGKKIIYSIKFLEN